MVVEDRRHRSICCKTTAYQAFTRIYMHAITRACTLLLVQRRRSVKTGPTSWSRSDIASATAVYFPDS